MFNNCYANSQFFGVSLANAYEKTTEKIEKPFKYSNITNMLVLQRMSRSSERRLSSRKFVLRKCKNRHHCKTNSFLASI